MYICNQIIVTKIKTMEQKYCNCCGVVKSIDQFAIDLDKKDGRKTQCKECYNHRQYNRRSKNAIEIEKLAIITGEKYANPRHHFVHKHVCQYCGKTLEKPTHLNVCSDKCKEMLQKQVCNDLKEIKNTEYSYARTGDDSKRLKEYIDNQK